MASTYAGKCNEAGLYENGDFSPEKCTIPFYRGYKNLRVLDFANVAVKDDELRYLIKLDNLQALGLAGTNITNKGVKYLSQHASFVNTLLCLKLCYNPQIDDRGVRPVSGFKALKELDLYKTNVTLDAIVELLGPTWPHILTKCRLPDKANSRLDELHLLYEGLNRKHSDLIFNVDNIHDLSASELRRQLKFHKETYADIFLNLSLEDLSTKLQNVLVRRRKEEYLWSISI